MATGAKYGVISVGTRFSSHPSPETIQALEAMGMEVFSTADDGAVTIVSDGRSIQVRSSRRRILSRIWIKDGGTSKMLEKLHSEVVPPQGQVRSFLNLEV
jgi:hypothetical protein